MLFVHIVLGAMAIVSGCLALCVPKGRTLHRRVGSSFVICMLSTGFTGIVLALVDFNVFFLLIGAFAIYLTYSGWHAIRQPDGVIGRVELVSPLAAVMLAVSAASIAAWSIVNGRIVAEMPAPLYLGYAFYGVVFALLDVWKIRRGGWTGSARIADHLWRMIMALIFAATALFVANGRVFPEPLQTPAFQWAPVALLFLALAYWLVRVLGARRDFRQAAAPREETTRPT